MVRIHKTLSQSPSDPNKPKQSIESKSTSEAYGRKITHQKSKSKPSKSFVALEELQKVGLDVKHKTASVKRFEAPPTRQIEEVQPSQKKDVYVPRKVLEQRREGTKFKSIQSTTAESMLQGKTAFAKTKLTSLSNIQTPKELTPKAFPKKSLTRLLTGDVKPEWIVGLGKMKTDKKTPEEGYKDCFVSSLEEYERKGINFDPSQVNNPIEMGDKLDLMDSDVEKIKNHGAWLVEIHPSSKLAVPTERKNEWNPGYVEGGYTASGQQEWVTPNIALDEEARAGRIKIFKMSPDGKTVEWKFFQGKLYPNIPNDSNGTVEGSYNNAIDTHIKNSIRDML